jgi:deoxyadenosine/deoxycytidine kinase
MGKLVTIVGNSGSGKTTLAEYLSKVDPPDQQGFQVFLEEHVQRPFQAAFMQDNRYGLANQVDYLLFRAEQEQAARASAQICVQDGGLDLDFYLFTRLFYQRGYFSLAEFDLCERLYRMLRSLLPPPELVVYLHAPLEVLAERKAGRQRALDISLVEDLQVMDALLAGWLRTLDPRCMLSFDNGSSEPHWQEWTEKILAFLSK